jgi:hypothetical protein
MLAWKLGPALACGQCTCHFWSPRDSKLPQKSFFRFFFVWFQKNLDFRISLQKGAHFASICEYITFFGLCNFVNIFSNLSHQIEWKNNNWPIIVFSLNLVWQIRKNFYEVAQTEIASFVIKYENQDFLKIFLKSLLLKMEDTFFPRQLNVLYPTARKKFEKKIAEVLNCAHFTY